MKHGSLGENVVLDLEPWGAAHLRPGARLLVGGVLLEVTDPCGVCAALARVHPSLPKLARRRRGSYARVVTGGLVAVGDEIAWLPEVKVA